MRFYIIIRNSVTSIRGNAGIEFYLLIELRDSNLPDTRGPRKVQYYQTFIKYKE